MSIDTKMESNNLFDDNCKRIVVVIPAHNEEENIYHALYSLQHQTHPPTGIIVVNDGSTDNTAKIVLDFFFEYKWRAYLIDVLNLPRSEGYGVGLARNLNEGKKYLDKHIRNYDYLMVMDADYILARNYIAECITAFEENMIVVGGLTYGLRTKSIRGAHRIYPKWFVDTYPFPAVRGWDGAHIYQAIGKGCYQTKVVDTAVAYEMRKQGRGNWWREFTKGIDAYKCGYTVVNIISRMVKSIYDQRFDSTLFMPFGYVFANLSREVKHTFSENVTQKQKQRISTLISRLFNKVYGA